MGSALMEFRYKGGQPMPANVIEAIQYIGKVGVITRPFWYQHFSHGNAQWRRDQLLNLVRRGVFQSHSCTSVNNVWVLSDWSIDQLKRKGIACVRPIPPQYIEHDEMVGGSLLLLQRNKVCASWTSERELRMSNSQAFKIQTADGESKYPDATFRMLYQGQQRTFAMEYERTGKSVPRYRSILLQYAALPHLSMVVFVTEDESATKRIQGALKFIGSPELASRISFSKAADWKHNPMTAPIKMRSKTRTFEELIRSSV
jgi:hypothetical protein